MLLPCPLSRSCRLITEDRSVFVSVFVPVSVSVCLSGCVCLLPTDRVVMQTSISISRRTDCRQLTDRCTDRRIDTTHHIYRSSHCRYLRRQLVVHALARVPARSQKKQPAQVHRPRAEPRRCLFGTGRQVRCAHSRIPPTRQIAHGCTVSQQQTVALSPHA